MTTLIKSTNFPWLLSNIIDSNTDAVPEPLKRYWITQKQGVKIGVIGLVEEDWIATIPSWPEEFRYRPMAETAREISRELREEHGVEVIIALTHCRVPNVSVIDGVVNCLTVGHQAGEGARRREGRAQ